MADFNWRNLRRYQTYLIGGVVLAIMMFLVLIRTPGPSPRPKASRPPTARARELVSEPTISVFMHLTGEVRQMPIEEYIAGVVAGEMNPNWPVEALAAQAIIARTFTLNKIRAGGVPRRGTQASTDPEEFQAFNSAAITPNVRKAVARTRGLVITHNGEPIIAWFHASSGGITATAKEGLDFDKVPTPYIKVVRDLRVSREVAWRRSFSPEEVRAAAIKVGVDPGPVRSIRIGSKGPSGRATTLVINDRELSAPAFRLAIGSTLMRSTLLDRLEFSQGTILMRGRGFGHGVGMSQWGAWSMARRGRKAEEIVRFYFKGIEIERFWK